MRGRHPLFALSRYSQGGVVGERVGRPGAGFTLGVAASLPLRRPRHPAEPREEADRQRVPSSPGGLPPSPRLRRTGRRTGRWTGPLGVIPNGASGGRGGSGLLIAGVRGRQGLLGVGGGVWAGSGRVRPAAATARPHRPSCRREAFCPSAGVAGRPHRPPRQGSPGRETKIHPRQREKDAKTWVAATGCPREPVPG